MEWQIAIIKEALRMSFENFFIELENMQDLGHSKKSEQLLGEIRAYEMCLVILGVPLEEVSNIRREVKDGRNIINRKKD